MLVEPQFHPNQMQRVKLRKPPTLCWWSLNFSLPKCSGSVLGDHQLYVGGASISSLPKCSGSVLGDHQLYVGGASISSLPKCSGSVLGDHQLYVGGASISTYPK